MFAFVRGLRSGNTPHTWNTRVFASNVNVFERRPAHAPKAREPNDHLMDNTGLQQRE